MPLPIRDLPLEEHLQAISDEGDTSAARAILTLFFTSRALYGSTQSLFKQHGISDAKWSVLMILATAEGRGLQPSEIAAQLTVTRGTVTGLLNGLERDRLVTRHTHAGDGRRDVIRLSSGGARLLKDVAPAIARWHAEAAAALTRSERQTLIRLLQKLQAP